MFLALNFLELSIHELNNYTLCHECMQINDLKFLIKTETNLVGEIRTKRS